MRQVWVRFKNSSPVFLISLIGALVGSITFLVLGVGLFAAATVHLRDGQAWLYILASFGAFSVTDRCFQYIRQEIGPFKDDVALVDVAPLDQAADFQRIRSRWNADN